MNFNQTNNNQGDAINNGSNAFERVNLICKRNAIMATIEIAKSGEFGVCNDDVESELSPILTAIKVRIAAFDKKAQENE